MKQAIYTQDEGEELEIPGVGQFELSGFSVQEVRRLLKKHGVTDVQVPKADWMGFMGGDPIPGDYETEDFLDMLDDIDKIVNG